MSRMRIGTAGIALVALLAFPRAASANVVDFIWAMSGPQMVGAVVLHCKVYFDGRGSTCKVLDDIFNRSARRGSPREFGPGEARLSVETIFFTSTGRNSQGDDHRAFRTQMVALEPMLEIGSVTAGSARLYHGLGLSLDRLFGSDFDQFGKVGVKLRAVGATIPFGRATLDIAFNVRFYRDGFTRQDFGFARRPGDKDHFNEQVYGASFGLAW